MSLQPCLIQELKACLSQGTQISGAIATPEPSSPAPAKQHRKAFRSAGGPYSAWATRPHSVSFFAVQISGAGCHRDAYMVSDPRHPEDDSNGLVMKVSNSNDRAMQEDTCW